MMESLLRLAYEYEIPMALESVTREAVRTPLNLRLKDRTLKDVIVAIVHAEPGFRVDFTDSLVDVYSPGARLDPTNPLNMTVREYDVTKMDTHLADAQLLCMVERRTRSSLRRMWRKRCRRAVGGRQHYLASPQQKTL